MARGKRTASRAAGVQNASSVYEDMLAEAGVSSRQQQVDAGRPLKRRRGPGQANSGAAASQDGDNDEDDEDEADVQFEDVALPEPTMQTMDRDSDSDEEPDVEFEDVDFTPLPRDEGPTADTPKDLELNLTAEKAAASPQRRGGADRRKPLSREERQRRVRVHQTHLLCLLFHAARRNQWANDAKVKEYLRPHLTDKMVMYMTPGPNLSQFGRAESLKNGLQQVGGMWRSKFEITERGLRRALWAEDAQDLQDYEPPEDMESCLDREDFRNAARTLQGSRDIGAQLYCALLRSIGVRARLVCSLQPLACSSGAPAMPKPKRRGSPAKPSRDDQVLASMAKHLEREQAARASVSAAAGSPTPRRRLGHPGAASYGFEPSAPPKETRPTFVTPKRIRESAYPVYWVEILDVGHQKWQPVDPVVTHTFWKPRVLEPPITDKENCLTYVVAFEADGTAKDVTRRYAKAYTAKTRRQRIEGSAEDGDQWWRKALEPFSRRRRDHLDQIEDNELAGAEAREPMPRNVQDFKDHPVYALERHLRRHEVLVRDATPSGTVSAGSRGGLERVYRRKDVRVARTADKWYRMGREVRANEIPAKWLPKKARAGNGDHGQGEGDDGGAGTPIYTLDQTDLYTPAPVRDGRVPKNRFGNIDVYVPSMVPRGAVHIDEEGAARAAFLLGVDYAPALTGFSFRGRQGTAVLRGAVVAEESGEAVRAVLEGMRDAEREAEEGRRRAWALRMWRRLLTGLRIRERVWGGVEEEDVDEDGIRQEEERAEASDVTEEYNMVVSDDDDDDGGGDGDGGGGFLFDDGDADDGGGGGGGFIPE